MAERQRSLPSWMRKKEEKRQKHEPPKSRRKQKTASAVFYCMNEKELVEAAISILHDAPCEDALPPSDRQGAQIYNLRPKDVIEDEESALEKAKEKCSASEKTEQQVMEEGQSSDVSHAQDTTYVSETDLDITELETLPYASSPPQQNTVGQRSGPVQDHSDLLGVELEEEGNVQTAAGEDEDGLQLVREIFFR